MVPGVDGSSAEFRLHEYSWVLLYSYGDLGGHVLVSGADEHQLN